MLKLRGGKPTFGLNLNLYVLSKQQATKRSSVNYFDIMVTSWKNKVNN
jgi:hypothetical protein